MLSTSGVRWLMPLVLAVGGMSAAAAGPREDSYWQVDDVRAGMRGFGRTVMKGTKVETFEVEVLGVLKNTSPGRDMILCRLAGLDLEKTGIIAGMSGSPVYLEGKLLGAVAYAWPFGKEPIAGITPFSQMHGYVEAYERRDLVEQQDPPARVGLKSPWPVDRLKFGAVSVAQDFAASPADEGDLRLVPLQTPVSARGFTPHALRLFRQHTRHAGLVPMEGGGVTGQVADEEKNTLLVPGGPLSVALVQGDFDMSGIGTVTHIEGKRVYGWGHPFFGIGTCEFPLMTGYIHTVCPRQSISFKMGSPLRTVGVINADVSTGIAGWLDREPDLLPVRMTVSRATSQADEGRGKTFHVRVVRQRAMLATLVYTVLTNSLDMEGELPEELTAELRVRIEVEGHEPIVIQDTFSGSSFSGGRAPAALYYHVASIINLLSYNTYQPVRIRRIDCETHVFPGRRTADIEAIELDSETYSPGDTLQATVYVRPYKGLRQRIPVRLQLPADLPEGDYTATVCDDLANARNELRDNPVLANPQDLDQLFAALAVQTQAKRTNLVVRLPTSGVGVALAGKPLPNLPPSMVHILGNTRRTGTQTMTGALVSRHRTDWVIQGSDSVSFTVTKNKKLTMNQR
jgi:hypothetical protein